jgi:hypothetical protein
LRFVQTKRIIKIMETEKHVPYHVLYAKRLSAAALDWSLPQGMPRHSLAAPIGQLRSPTPVAANEPRMPWSAR